MDKNEANKKLLELVKQALDAAYCAHWGSEHNYDYHKQQDVLSKLQYELEQIELVSAVEKVKPKADKVWHLVEEDLPPPETPVLAILFGEEVPKILELVWERCNPMIEPYYNDYLRWDEVHNDGQNHNGMVTKWRHLPE